MENKQQNSEYVYLCTPKIGMEEIRLPSSLNLTDKVQDRVISTLLEVLRR